MLLSCCMTPFEIVSIVIGIFTSLGTVGATIVALRSSHLNSTNRFKIKNCEKKRFFKESFTDDDIIFTNLGRTNAQVEMIKYTINGESHLVKELYNETGKITLFYKVAPLETVRIRSVFDVIAKNIVPRDDFFNEKYDYRRFYSNRHIKFTLKNSLGETYKKRSKYSIRHYLKVYDKDNIVSPWQIELVERFVAETKQTCIYLTTGRNYFKVYIPNDTDSLIKIMNYIQENNCKESNYLITPALVLVSNNSIRYFTIFDKEMFKQIAQYLEEKCKRILLTKIKETRDLNDLLYAMFNSKR